jgi:hypothetical protein
MNAFKARSSKVWGARMKLGRVQGVVAVATVILMAWTVAPASRRLSRGRPGPALLVSQSRDKRKIIIDQDAAGPAGTDQQAILLLIQSPQTEVLGITVVTGDAWLTEEVAHTLRMLELIGRTDIPVVRGAEYPLVRTKEETEQWEQRYGSVAWLGAWTPRVYHAPRELGTMPEGKPTTKAADEDAPHFLVRMVRKYPHDVTIYEGGPMTNLALAISIDPEFPKLAKNWCLWERVLIRRLPIPSSQTIPATNSISGSIPRRLALCCGRRGTRLSARRLIFP